MLNLSQDLHPNPLFGLCPKRGPEANDSMFSGSGNMKPINKENEMYTQSQQTSTLNVARGPRSVRFGPGVIWLIAGLMVISLLTGLIWTQMGQYPGAEPQAAGSLSQQSTYQTSDDLPKVLRWYTRHFGIGHEMPQGDDCVTMTRVDAHLFFQESIVVTLCAQPRQTLIFVNRSLTMR
jgi:hypothetical protein